MSCRRKNDQIFFDGEESRRDIESEGKSCIGLGEWHYKYQMVAEGLGNWEGGCSPSYLRRAPIPFGTEVWTCVQYF